VRASVATLAAAVTAAPDDEDAIGNYVEAALTAADAEQLAGRTDGTHRTCDDALARAQPLQQHALIYNRVRRAKLLLCVDRTVEAAPLLQQIDASGYHDRFLDRLRRQAGIATTTSAQTAAAAD
jgi:hypothetical protein